MNGEHWTIVDGVVRAGGTHVPPDELRDAAGVVTPEEARGILSRFVASHFDKRDREHARFTIPLDPRRDDDVRMSVFISGAAACINALVRHRDLVGVTGDGGLVVFGRNYYTMDVSKEGSPVAGCGVIGLDVGGGIDEKHGAVVAVRTEDGEEFETFPDELFVDRAAAEKRRDAVQALAATRAPSRNETTGDVP